MTNITWAEALKHTTKDEIIDSIARHFELFSALYWKSGKDYQITGALIARLPDVTELPNCLVAVVGLSVPLESATKTLAALPINTEIIGFLPLSEIPKRAIVCYADLSSFTDWAPGNPELPIFVTEDAYQGINKIRSCMRKILLWATQS